MLAMCGDDSLTLASCSALKNNYIIINKTSVAPLNNIDFVIAVISWDQPKDLII